MALPQFSGQPILILKEGSTRTRGREAQRANITAARVISDVVKSSLGPKGMDKMLVDSFGDVTVTNDGATILKEMEVEHPVAKIMIEVAKTQDQEAGDGTTTAVVLAGDLLNRAQNLMEKNVHPNIILEGYASALEKASQFLDGIGVEVQPTNKRILNRIAEVAMATKLLTEERVKLATLATDAILYTAEYEGGKHVVDVENVKVEKKAGAGISDTQLIKGLIIDKEVVHARMPKRVDGAKIALLIKPLEIEKTEFDAKLSIEKPEQLEAFIKKEEGLLKDMVETIAKSGANVLICQRGIDEVAQHYLAKKGILATRRVKVSDIEKLAKATGAKIVTEPSDLTKSDLGHAKVVEEKKIGDDRMLFIEGCRDPKAVTIFVRGGTERIVNETERAIHDALCVVRDVVQEPKIVAGGGAPEAEIAKKLREYARKTSGRPQLAVLAFADALDSIPMALAENAGLDPVDILVELRARHEKGETWAGVDPFKGTVRDMYKLGVYEPMSVKRQALASATEAASMILKVDDLISAGKGKGGMPPAKGPEEGAGETEES